MRDTQIDAWESVQETIGEKRRKVLTAIKELNGATLFELVGHLNWPVNRISGRVTELNHLEYIYDCGERRINPTSKRKGIVWKKRATTHK